MAAVTTVAGAAQGAGVPRTGMLATVRNRRGVVSAVEPFDGEQGRIHLVHLEYKDSHSPSEERLLWELEPARELLEPNALPLPSETPMPPADFDALLRAARWTALSPYLDPDGEGPLEREPIASPFHGSVRVEDYQLVPLLKALRMPRVNLLIADDVGLGKTIEAGLILTELLLRRRIQRVLVLTPASLRQQWRDELWEKFALRFEIVDRQGTERLKRRLGMDANPWRSFSRIVASYHYLRQPDVREQFLAACQTPEGSPHLSWDLLIVDECHNLMPSPFGEDSELCRTLRLVAPRFEHRLFLSATPHNGHTRSFTGLLEMLDPVRFMLGDDGPNGWGIKYAREFDMTNDSRLFPPRPQWEAKRYRPDEYSRWLLGDWRPIEELWAELGVDPSRPEPAEIELEDWLFDTTAGPERRAAEAKFVHGHLLKPGDVARTNWRVRCAQPPYDRLPVARAKIPAGVVLSREGDAWICEDAVEDVALPFMQGAMLNQFDFSQKGWVSGTGLQARWNKISWEHKTIDPQFLMSIGNAGPEISTSTKVAFRRIARSTDVRTMIASVASRIPCGDVASVLRVDTPMDAGTLALVLNSFAVDTIARRRIVGTHVDYHYARELPLLVPEVARSQVLNLLALGLNCPSHLCSSEWCAGTANITQTLPWRTLWGVTTSARIHMRILADVLVARLLGLDARDLRDILASCDHPRAHGDVRGFWRVDKDRDPELRHTVLAMVAFDELGAKLECEPNGAISLEDGQVQGWLLPDELRLADYSLGQDGRALHPQPVSSRLGPRFLDW